MFHWKIPPSFPLYQPLCTLLLNNVVAALPLLNALLPLDPIFEQVYVFKVESDTQISDFVSDSRITQKGKALQRFYFIYTTNNFTF